MPLDLIHKDLVGPFRNASLAGCRYFITLYNDASAFSMVRFLKLKVEAGDDLKSMILELERMQNGKGGMSFVRQIRSENGTELFPKT